VGASSNPVKISKLLKNIKNFIQKTYKSPDNIVKALQQLAKPKLNYDTNPPKKDYKDKDREYELDAFKIAVFEWKEDYKVMKIKKERYTYNKSNAWAVTHNQCANMYCTQVTPAYASVSVVDSDTILLVLLLNTACAPLSLRYTMCPEVLRLYLDPMA
jgi:hypothetical protein